MKTSYKLIYTKKYNPQDIAESIYKLNFSNKITIFSHAQQNK